MTKKQKILDKLSEKHWHKGSCCITYDDFREMDMRPTYEYGEKYNDVIYARRVLKKEGYKVLLGTYGLYIYQKESEILK